ncbi:hypothetical protein A1O3_07038 [Capronia epimyces CBS 606.96]|uniref:Xylanolytic transcriptional activator regulatory domain-containing protein n=1 Tax=Capronia epimyces CBS 606.96 TaxID=1182542 RepID=W9YEM5_9EURO|nr:uncharacterized protein A1O3_07038 [Capronia epimyces CBS 606.96]EXJ80754.1 hypothetical protein A1O3_07038 [Capronia epimyces CBS 606.96]
MKSSILPASVETETASNGLTNEPELDGHDILTLNAIPSNVADALIKVYIEKVLPQYPFFLAETLYSYQSILYHGTGTGTVDGELQRRAEFIVAMMMAISTLTSRSPNHSRLMSLSESLYRYAMQRYDTLSAPSLCQLQCTMLLCQFANFCPAIAEVWTLKEMAMRMALAIGLHREPEAGLEAFDVKETELRRQIFWTLYSMDRSISVTAHRAVSVDDELIDTAWPYHDLDDEPASRWKTQTIRFLRHVRFRQIQSEIFAVNFQGKDLGPVPYADWMKARDGEILEWRRSLDSLQNTGFDWFEFVGYTGQLYLHMHCPRNPHPDTASMVTGFGATNGMADGYLRMLRKGFLKFDWHCAHQATAAGILLIRMVKDHYQTLLQYHSSRHVNDVLDKYTDILTLLSDRWPTASVCLQKFESLKSDLFHAFSLSADILLSANANVNGNANGNANANANANANGNANAHAPSASAVTGNRNPLTSLTPADAMGMAVPFPIPIVMAESGEGVVEADQVFDTSDLESWAYTINIFRDYTEQDWDMMAGQAEMHWPF